MNLNRSSYSSTAAVPVDLLGAPWVGEVGGELASHYYRARYYDSKLGRFISEDPVGIEAAPGAYLYASGRPSLLKDPFGLYPITECKGLRKASVCCKGGKLSLCIPAGAPEGPDRECLIMHETGHADRIAMDCDGNCSGGPCTPFVNIEPAQTQECAMTYIQWDCLMKKGQPDGSSFKLVAGGGARLRGREAPRGLW